MNRGKGQVQSRLGGYTIVETLIFLAVSAAMFVLAIGFVSGQQNKVEFVNSVRDFEQQLTDVANNVSTGYYEYPSGLTCNVDASYIPQVGAAGSGACILIGTAIKFGGGGPNAYSTVTLVGSKVNSSGVDVHSLAEANPVPVPSSVSSRNLLNGAKVGCIKRSGGFCPSTNNAAIGFFTKLSGSVAEDAGKNNIIRTDLLPYRTINISDSVASALSKMSTAGTGNYSTTAGVGLADPANINPQSMTVCLLSGTTNQYALVKISGASTGSLSISSEIFGGTVCP